MIQTIIYVFSIFLLLQFILSKALENSQISFCRTPAPRLLPSACCNIPQLFNESVFTNCRVEYPNATALSASFVECFLLCAFRAANVSSFIPLSVDGLSRAVTAQFIYRGEAQLATVITEALFKCINTSYASVIFNVGALQGKFICDPNALRIKGCINLEIFKSCPANRMIDQTGCDGLRRHLNRCVLPMEELVFY